MDSAVFFRLERRCLFRGWNGGQEYRCANIRDRVRMEEQYPAIRARARQKGAEIHGGDETGLRSNDVNGRGYAPKGRTPVRWMRGTAKKVNMIFTVTNQGKVRFMFYRGTMNACTRIGFFGRLLRMVDGKVFVILDNRKAHHARPVKTWLAKNAECMELFHRPHYSPDPSSTVSKTGSLLIKDL